MEKYKNSFNALTPKVLDENKLIYTEALDFAFSKDDIKNIAITGIYGSGKSTVWNTYIKSKNYKKIITVSLGKYEDNEIIEKTDSKNVRSKSQQKKIDNENRIERQLINQILSQIDSKKIPLSKYRFKFNKSWLDICLQVIGVFSIIASILIWVTKNSFIQFIKQFSNKFKETDVLPICAILLFLPLSYFLYVFFRDNKLRISKINVKGAEANFDSFENNDETILDRDIKEIVYLLNSSKAEIVVFEDLDRYDNIEIYTKLRELNFLLNSYVNANGYHRIIRFVYMLKDGLFFSKNRTKFFDFILPIVPIVDSRTSENQLLKLLKGVKNSPDRDVLANIALYVDDMRLLKNIVNEYIIYSNIIPLEDIELEKNKLFSLITLKNIFPNEFDLLQNDRGYIRSVFDKLEKNRKNVIDNLQNEFENVKSRVNFIEERLEKDKFQMMALMIPVDVKIINKGNIKWDDFLKNWSENKDANENVSHFKGNLFLTYEQFIERFVANTEEKKNNIEKMPVNRDTDLDLLHLKMENIKNRIKNVETFNFKDILCNLNSDQRDEVFSTEYNIKESHYFSLIRFLISDGLIDETYWYYKGNFDIEKSETLKRNDIIYKKGLLEGKKIDVFLDVETPKEIINRLKESDYNRFNILNKKILQYCIDENYFEKALLITNTSINNSIIDLVEVINSFDFKTVYKYVSFLLKEKVECIVEILKNCTNESMIAFKNILISICINDEVSIEQFQIFSSYIEQNEDIILLVDEEKFKVFIKNITDANIKFEILSNAEVDVERLIQIEKIQAYKLNIQNIIFIVNKLLGETTKYGNLLNEIYQLELLKSTKQYIKDNFVVFISQYIDANTKNELYNNIEEILVEILISDISNEHKIKYLRNNKTIVTKVQVLESISENEDIFSYLFNEDMIEFNKENVSSYWNMTETYSNEFLNYLDRNIDEKNADNILAGNKSICNFFINDSDVSDKLFSYVIRYADKEIKEVNSNLSSDKIHELIQKKLLSVTDHNIESLLFNSYYEEIVMLANSTDQEFEEDVLTKLLNHDLDEKLIYMLINSNISDENAIKLINKIEDKILIKYIVSNKKVLIRTIINKNLSDANIEFVCQNFESFCLKEEFINNLESQNKLIELSNENLNENVMLYILDNQNISIDTKIQLIVIKIDNRTNIDELIRYIKSVNEISDIADVWNKKYPIIDSNYKKTISQALIKGNYVKERNDKDAKKIMLAK